RTLPPAGAGTDEQLQGESGAGTGRTGGQGSEPVVLDADRLLPPSWHRPTARGGGGPLRVLGGRGITTRYLSARASAGGQAAQSTDRLGRAGLLPHVVLSDVPDVPALRLQGVSNRSPALLRWGSPRTGNDRQHPCGGVARHRARDGAGARNGGFC